MSPCKSILFLVRRCRVVSSSWRELSTATNFVHCLAIVCPYDQSAEVVLSRNSVAPCSSALFRLAISSPQPQFVVSHWLSDASCELRWCFFVRLSFARLLPSAAFCFPHCSTEANKSVNAISSTERKGGSRTTVLSRSAYWKQPPNKEIEPVKYNKYYLFALPPLLPDEVNERVIDEEHWVVSRRRREHHVFCQNKYSNCLQR